MNCFEIYNSWQCIGCSVLSYHAMHSSVDTIVCIDIDMHSFTLRNLLIYIMQLVEVVVGNKYHKKIQRNITCRNADVKLMQRENKTIVF